MERQMAEALVDIADALGEIPGHSVHEVPAGCVYAEHFRAIGEDYYLSDKYRLIVGPSGGNPSRTCIRLFHE